MCDTIIIMYARTLRQILFLNRQKEIARKRRLYDQKLNRTDIERIQVDRFNKVWRYCLSEVPFYQHWKAENGLPASITKPSDLQSFPVLKKRDIVDRADEIFQHGTISAAYLTGGSTGTPVRYPRGEGETLEIYANTYLGRSWWGIRPFDSYVHLWGHAHLFGASAERFAGAKRRAADRVVNATRLSAYDVTQSAFRSHYDTLLRRNPTYLVGYTSTIVKLARYIDGKDLDARRLARLRAVIVTAETVTPADVNLMKTVFRVPVIIEYGAAETGTMATSRGASWPLQVLWDSYILLLADDGALTVTTLSDRLFPLVNYQIGDQAEPGDVESGNALTLASVLGRIDDVVRVATNDRGALELSAHFPVHLLRDGLGITSIQFRQDAPDRLSIFLQADHQLSLTAVAETFTREMRRDYPTFDPASVTFEQVSEPQLTKAGKHALFVR
jgi:phenylacetate-CoA ligase